MNVQTRSWLECAWDKVAAVDSGKWADIIAANDEPLKDISMLEKVPLVMKSGMVYKSEPGR